jgi:hypothetical protein
MPPGVMAAPLCPGRHARIRLACIGGGVACPRFPEGDAAAGGKDRPGAWQGGESGEGEMALGAWGDGVVNVFDGLQGHAALADEGLAQERRGALTPSSVVSGVALVMAWMRWSMTVAERP